MTAKVVVLGAGYAGAGAIRRLESELDPGDDLTWVADRDYHLVLHESHRVVRDPEVRKDIAIPVEEIKAPSTTFVRGEVVDVDVDDRTVALADGQAVAYDYVLVALGSQTAFYGVPGLAEHALTLKSLDDALAIHDALESVVRAATRNDPARVVIGGAGLSGIQCAGEVAAYRDARRAPIDVSLVEALPEVLPGGDDRIQRALRGRLEAAGVEVLTDDPITEADADRVHFDGGDPLPYDVLVWTGGITGRDALEGAAVEKDHNRLDATATFATSDDRVFAVGDSAVVEQDGDPAPPTAQAAWQAAEVAGRNVARAVDGRPLETWRHDDKGTVVSVGDDAVAHNVKYPPFSFVDTFGSVPARFLKKFVAARWIADVSSWSRALRAWGSL